MDVITTYLYGSIDNDIYMKILEGFRLPEANTTKKQKNCDHKKWSQSGQ